MQDDNIQLGHAGLDTSLMFIRFAGDVGREGAYTVMRVPSNPDFYSGNALVLPSCPQDADRARLERDFARLVGTPPAIAHRTFLWPARPGDTNAVDGFLAAGYTYACHPVLLLEHGGLRSPVHGVPGLEIRPFASDSDWAVWRDMNLRELAGLYPEEAQHAFLDQEQRMFRRLEEAGRGHWWGAFLDGRQVAHLGLYFEGDTGRFQAVLTDPDFRRRGICAQLVHHVAHAGLQRAVRLVIVADEAHGAGRVYGKLGFVQRERIGQLMWAPPANPAPSSGKDTGVASC